LKTLIVEDEFVCRRLLQRLLSSYGECDIAVNGREALEAITLARHEQEPYDLVCLDIRMPAMDGYEALKAIRQEEAKLGIGGLKGVKVIMVTATNDSTNILQAFNTGCEAYAIKPIDRQKLLEQLKALGLFQETGG
jgi:two-component system chemotaxis response regulator CheY